MEMTFDERDDLMGAEDWKAMYMILQHAVTDVLDEIMNSYHNPEITSKLLIAVTEAEDYYMNVADAVVGAPEAEKVERAKKTALIRRCCSPEKDK